MSSEQNRGLSPVIGTVVRFGTALLVLGLVVYGVLSILGLAKPLRLSHAEAMPPTDVVDETEPTFTALGNIDHGKTRKEVEDAIRDEPFEICAAFDADERKLYEWTDFDPMKVETSLELARFAAMNGEVCFLHSHPSDNPFSKQDLKAAVARGVPEAVVVTPTRTFQLVAENGWPNYETASDYLDNLTSNFSIAQSMGLISITSREDETVTYTTTIKLVETFAEEFGLTFTVEPRSVVPQVQVDSAKVSSGYGR